MTSRRKLQLGIAVVVLVCLIAVGIYALAGNPSTASSNTSSSNAVSSSPVQNNTDQDTPRPPEGEPITITGIIECLSRVDTAGPQDTSCALGLKQNDGKSYALSSRDPMQLSGFPTGQKVQINGTLTQPTSKDFDIVGTIYIDTIQRL